MEEVQIGQLYLGNATGNIYYIFDRSQRKPFFRFIRLSTTREPIIDTWESFTGFDVSIKKINEEYEQRIVKAIFIADIKDKR